MIEFAVIDVFATANVPAAVFSDGPQPESVNRRCSPRRDQPTAPPPEKWAAGQEPPSTTLLFAPTGSRMAFPTLVPEFARTTVFVITLLVPSQLTPL
jgi:hypothetical protein